MKRYGVSALLTTAMISLAGYATAADAPAVDPALPVYQRTEGVQGKVTLSGSKTMSELAAIWSDNFRQLYPEATIDIKVNGSVNAVQSVINGESSFGLLSRRIEDQEVEAFQKKFGYLPTVITPALEPIAIYVQKDNPITSLTLEQLDAIFSTSLKRGAAKTATTWGDLGVAGEWATRPVAVYVRNEKTGSQVFIEKYVLGDGDFRSDARVSENNLHMVQSIGADQGGIGFAGAHFNTPDVKAVPIAWKAGDPAFEPNAAGYPLVRPLHIVLNVAPGKQLTKEEQEFVKYILSSRGQQDVVVGGFVPVPARAVEVALGAIGVEILR